MENFNLIGSLHNIVHKQIAFKSFFVESFDENFHQFLRTKKTTSHSYFLHPLGPKEIKNVG
jgi:hypothetical protein